MTEPTTAEFLLSTGQAWKPGDWVPSTEYTVGDEREQTAPIELNVYNQLLNPDGTVSGMIRMARWHQVDDIFNQLQEFCCPGGNECGTFLDDEGDPIEVYWVSKRYWHPDFDCPLNAGEFEPRSVVVYVDHGNESPIINVGWEYENPEYRDSYHERHLYKRFNVFPLAAIKAFTSFPHAWRIAGEIYAAIEC